LPVAVGFRRQTIFEGHLANYVGDLGIGSDPALIARVKEADPVLAIGTRLQEASTQGYTLFDHAGAAEERRLILKLCDGVGRRPASAARAACSHASWCRSGRA
jgi:thiamine pyrophosphate-dependent acetolactate synthase large subunit-like protein